MLSYLHGYMGQDNNGKYSVVSKCFIIVESFNMGFLKASKLDV